MKLAVIGSEGMLGNECVKHFKRKGIMVYEFDLCNGFDITDYDKTLKELKELVEDVGNDVIVLNCAAITDNNAPFEKMMSVNYNGVVNLKKACIELKLKLIHISTDYVYDYTSAPAEFDYDEIQEHLYPPLETIHDDMEKYNGLIGQLYSPYSWSKLMAERELTFNSNLNELDFRIVRVAWLYGQAKDGSEAPSFVSAILNRMKYGPRIIRVVNDQFGNPTSTKEAARLIDELIARWDDAPIIVNASCEGICSWYRFAVEILHKAVKYGVCQKFGFNESDIFLRKITTDEFNSLNKNPIIRPKWTPLHKGFFHEQKVFVQHWQEALDDYMKEIYDT